MNTVKDEDLVNSVVTPAFIASQLADRAKGYTGDFRNLLLAAASVIRSYQEAYPFKHCVAQWEHAYVLAGIEMSARVAEELNSPEIAKTIRDRPVTAEDINSATNRIMLHYASLVRARELLTELIDSGGIDAREYEKDITAIFFELPKLAPADKAEPPVKG